MKLSPAYLARMQAHHEDVRMHLHSKLRAPFDVAMVALRGRFLAQQGPRGFAEQAADYAKGRTKRGAIVTRAEPGESPHNWLPTTGSLAVDVVLNPAVVPVRAHPDDARFPDLWDTHTPEAVQAWKDLVDEVEAAGLRSGGRFSFVDLPHIEIRDWQSMRPTNWKDIVVAAGFPRPTP